MQRPLDQSDLIKQMEGVADQLADRGLTNPERLDLLRRQAQLGDLREAIATRARRANEPRRYTP